MLRGQQQAGLRIDQCNLDQLGEVEILEQDRRNLHEAMKGKTFKKYCRDLPVTTGTRGAHSCKRAPRVIARSS